MRANRSALRMRPTRNGEMPSTAPRFGSTGNTTPPPNPTKNVLAMTASTTGSGRFIRFPHPGGGGRATRRGWTWGSRIDAGR
jgi:hypothetical protein